MEAIYLKRAFNNGSINTVAKLTDKGEIEVGGGEILTADINSQENFELSLNRLKERNFVECTKNEYDEKVKSVVREINSII